MKKRKINIILYIDKIQEIIIKAAALSFQKGRLLVSVKYSDYQGYERR